jgi:hypothetical protein
MMMTATNPPPHQARLPGALPGDNFDFEPPTPEEWRRAIRGLAFAFLRQVSSDAQCFVATRLLTTHEPAKVREGAVH